MAEVRVAPDEGSAEIVLAPGERLASTSLANVLLARAGVRTGLDHAALAALADVTGPAAVTVAQAPAGQTVLGRAVQAQAVGPGRPVATIQGDHTFHEGLLQVAGDVHVTGDVAVHAVIVAIGDVRIDGDLAGGRVACGGRVSVAGAIRRESVVEAGGGVWATTIEAATVRSGGLVEVKADLVRSVVEAEALKVGGKLVGGEALVFGAAAVGVRDADEPPRLTLAPRPRPRALALQQAARRVEMEGQLGRLRQMLAAPNADAPTREKLGVAIATLVARLEAL